MSSAFSCQALWPWTLTSIRSHLHFLIVCKETLARGQSRGEQGQVFRCPPLPSSLLLPLRAVPQLPARETPLDSSFCQTSSCIASPRAVLYHKGRFPSVSSSGAASLRHAHTAPSCPQLKCFSAKHFDGSICFVPMLQQISRENSREKGRVGSCETGNPEEHNRHFTG